jgi:hypothetical protein
VTSADMMLTLVADLQARSVEVLLAQVKGTVRDRMRRTDLMDLVGEDHIYLSIGSGVEDFMRRSAGVADDEPGAEADRGPAADEDPAPADDVAREPADDEDEEPADAVAIDPADAAPADIGPEAEPDPGAHPAP